MARFGSQSAGKPGDDQTPLPPLPRSPRAPAEADRLQEGEAEGNK